MKIALIQQKATGDKYANLKKGLAAAEEAARNGAQLTAFAELAFEPFYPQHPAGNETQSHFPVLSTSLNPVIIRLLFRIVKNNYPKHLFFCKILLTFVTVKHFKT